MTVTLVATIEPEIETDERPEPIRIIRERRWNRTTRQYETVIVTREQLVADRQRSAYVQEYNPCGVA